MLICLLSVPFLQFPFTMTVKALPTLLLISLATKIQQSSIRNLLLAALSFSLLGDLVLTLPLDLALHSGIIAFICAQGAYIILFLKNAEFSHKRLTIFLTLLLLMALSFYGLYSYLDDMKIPVIVYSCWLIIMIFCALHVKQQTSIISIGAFLFLFSDLSFAVNQFIFANDKFISILVMYLYYAAQFLFVIGVFEMKNFREGEPVHSVGSVG
jgi:uncharacterized membrane protein YhhN